MNGSREIINKNIGLQTVAVLRAADVGFQGISWTRYASLTSTAPLLSNVRIMKRHCSKQSKIGLRASQITSSPLYTDWVVFSADCIGNVAPRRIRMQNRGGDCRMLTCIVLELEETVISSVYTNDAHKMFHSSTLNRRHTEYINSSSTTGSITTICKLE